MNRDSTLAGTNIVAAPSGTTPVAKGGLPDRFLYIVGADVRVTRRLTARLTYTDNDLFGSPELVSQTYTDLCAIARGRRTAPLSDCTVYKPGTTHTDIAQKIADINVTDASLGLKYRVFGRLVFTGNVAAQTR